MSPIAIALNGASGRMGQALQELLRDDDRFAVAACIRAAGDWSQVPKHDVMVDFSTPGGFDAALAQCLQRGIPLVSGTTGLDDRQRASLAAAADSIAVLHAANFSLGIAVLARLLGEAAAALPDWDIEVLEAHHARKVDAPSGTALALGEAAATARGGDLGTLAVRGRDGYTGPRAPGTIGFASLRAGDIAGEHTAFVVGPDERLELTHRAGNRRIFARGALAAAAWIVGRPAGSYQLADVLAKSRG